MKVNVIKKYFDLELQREVDVKEKLDVTKERARQLKDLGLVKLIERARVDVDKENAVLQNEAMGKSKKNSNAKSKGAM